MQTFCDKDLGKHRILFTQVFINNLSHQVALMISSKLSIQNQLVDYWKKRGTDSMELSIVTMPDTAKFLS